MLFVIFIFSHRNVLVDDYLKLIFNSSNSFPQSSYFQPTIHACDKLLMVLYYDFAHAYSAAIIRLYELAMNLLYGHILLK